MLGVTIGSTSDGDVRGESLVDEGGRGKARWV